MNAHPPLNIRPVKNGFIVDTRVSVGRNGMLQSDDDLHVFRTPEELGRFITEHYRGGSQTDQGLVNPPQSEVAQLPDDGKPPRGWRRVTHGQVKAGDLLQQRSTGDFTWANNLAGHHVKDLKLARVFRAPGVE